MIKAEAPKEDPAIAAQRKQEAARSEASQTETTQQLLQSDTLARIRRFGGVGASGSLFGRLMQKMAVAKAGPTAGGGGSVDAAAVRYNPKGIQFNPRIDLGL